MSKEIKTHEEFIESRRSRGFKGEYTPEEMAFWMRETRAKNERTAIEHAERLHRLLPTIFPKPTQQESKPENDTRRVR